MSDFCVDRGASGDVPTLSDLKQTVTISYANAQPKKYNKMLLKITNPLIPVHTEKPGMVSLLDYYKSDAWLVVLLKLYTGFTDR